MDSTQKAQRMIAQVRRLQQTYPDFAYYAGVLTAVTAIGVDPLLQVKGWFEDYPESAQAWQDALDLYESERSIR